MGQLRDIESQLDQLGFQIIAISPDQPANLQNTSQQLGIRFTLLSDSAMNVSKSFGVAYAVDEATLNALAQHGVDIEASSGASHHLLPVPAVFLVAGSGMIQFEYVNPDYSVRAHPDLILTAARVARK